MVDSPLRLNRSVEPTGQRTGRFARIAATHSVNRRLGFAPGYDAGTASLEPCQQADQAMNREVIVKIKRSEIERQRLSLLAQGWTVKQVAERLLQDDPTLNRLFAFRLVSGLTQKEVARRWNEALATQGEGRPISEQYISYWENWPSKTGRRPTVEALRVLARIYDCHPGDLITSDSHTNPEMDYSERESSLSLAGTAETRLPKVSADDPFTRLLGQLRLLAGTPVGPTFSARQRDSAYQHLLKVLTTWADSMKRRQVLQILGWAATSAATGNTLQPLDVEGQERVLRAIKSPSRVDEMVIQNIEDVLWCCMRQDDSLGPHVALETVLAQRNLSRFMLGDCPSRLRTRLLTVYSNLSRFAGWLSFDLGDYENGWHYYEDARTTAHEAENTELGMFVLCNMSHLATWQGRPRVGIDHAVAAKGWTRRVDDPLLQAYVADVTARAYAANRDRSACFAELRDAEKSLSRGDAKTEGSFAYFYGYGEYESTRGLCLLEFKDLEEAVGATNESLQEIDPSFVRNGAFARITLAHAFTTGHEVDQAAQMIHEAAPLVVRNGSARLRQRFHTSHSRLQSWSNVRSVQNLNGYVSSLGLA
jgi:hypothetical protein